MISLWVTLTVSYPKIQMRICTEAKPIYNCLAVRPKDYTQSTGPQTMKQPVCGLLAQRRASSTQTGYFRNLQKKKMSFPSKHSHHIPTIQNQRRAHFLDAFKIVIFQTKMKQPVCGLDSSPSVGYQPVCGLVARLCSLVLTAVKIFCIVRNYITTFIVVLFNILCVIFTKNL